VPIRSVNQNDLAVCPKSTDPTSPGAVSASSWKRFEVGLRTISRLYAAVCARAEPSGIDA